MEEAVEQHGMPYTFLIMSDRWCEAVQEAEMGESISVEASKQRQNTTCFNPNRP
jgi:hypothetical protein